MPTTTVYGHEDCPQEIEVISTVEAVSNITLNEEAYVGPPGPKGDTGAAGDVRGITVEHPVTGDVFTLFYTEVTITISKLFAVLRGLSNPSVSFTLKFASNQEDAGTEVVMGGISVTNKSTGLTIDLFSNPVIPAGSFLWIELSSVSPDTDSFHVTMSY